jgi:fatty acid desaturase
MSEAVLQPVDEATDSSAPRLAGLARRGYFPERRIDPAVIMSLQAPSLPATMRALALDWGLIAAATWGSWTLFRSYGVTAWTLLAYALAVLAIGSRQKGLENLTHEGMHFNLARDRKLNDWIDKWFCGIWIAPAFDPDGQRITHIGNHHGHFAEEGVDGEYRGYIALGLGDLPRSSISASAKTVVMAFLRKTWWRLNGDYLSSPRRLVVIALFAAALQWLGLLKLLLLYWVVPYFAIYAPLRYLAEVSEHMGMHQDSEFKTSRNKLGWFQEWIMHPHGDGFHLVHHLYPAIPHQNLKQVHKMLMQDPIYRDCGTHTWSLIFPTRKGRSTLQDLLAKPRNASV